MYSWIKFLCGWRELDREEDSTRGKLYHITVILSSELESGRNLLQGSLHEEDIQQELVLYLA